MAAMGYCPSGRLFEAGACGTPVLSDWWTGLDEFFQPGEEILIATSCADAIRAITQDSGILKRIGSRARQRVLDCHTPEIRARQLIDLIESPIHQNATSECEITAYEGA
jgi:spore maturation protein CgeB